MEALEGEEECSAREQVPEPEAAAHDCRPVSSRIPHCVGATGRGHREARVPSGSAERRERPSSDSDWSVPFRSSR